MYIPIGSWPLDKNFSEAGKPEEREFLGLCACACITQVTECPQRRQAIINDYRKLSLSLKVRINCHLSVHSSRNENGGYLPFYRGFLVLKDYALCVVDNQMWLFTLLSLLLQDTFKKKNYYESMLEKFPTSSLSKCRKKVAWNCELLLRLAEYLSLKNGILLNTWDLLRCLMT